MKKFEILRYLKRFSILIFLVSLAGAAAIYLYADGKQQYTASVIIRADQRVAFETVAEVMAMAEAAKLSSFLAVMPPSARQETVFGQ